MPTGRPCRFQQVGKANAGTRLGTQPVEHGEARVGTVADRVAGDAERTRAEQLAEDVHDEIGNFPDLAR